MTSNPFRASFRSLLAAALTTCVLGACTTAPVTSTPDAGTDAAGSSRDDASPGSTTRPPAPRPKAPLRNDKAPVKVEKPAAKGPEIIVEEAPSEPPLVGPAWLSQCINRQTEGGVIRCDADRLLTEPSARVKVYTREPGAAGRTRTGPIQLRSNLPRKFRFFVVP